MIFGGSVDFVEDTKKRRLLFLRKEGVYYLVEKKQEKYVLFLKNNIINAASVGAMTGYFLKLPYIIWGAIALVFYVSYLILFNTKIFPGFEKLREKKIKVVPPSETKGRMLMFSLGFLAVGAGLLLCIPLTQVEGSIDSGAVVVCGAFSIIMGLRYLTAYQKSS